MDSLVSILQDELQTVKKELKKIAAAAAEKSFYMAQLPPVPPPISKNQYLFGSLHHSVGLLPDLLLLKAIMDIPLPQNALELHSFFGLASYYWHYVQNFAAIAAPLHQCTQKYAVYHWILECQEVFMALTRKHHLITYLITAFLDFNLPFCLYTDASQLGTGAGW